MIELLFSRPTIVSQKSIPSRYSSTDTNDSSASSYCPPDQRKAHGSYQPNEEITKLQQQNFQRSISNAESTSSNDDYLSEYTIEDNDQASNYSNNQRTVLSQRKQILLKALHTIDKQIEELDIQ
jgi:hypothetical protein